MDLYPSFSGAPHVKLLYLYHYEVLPFVKTGRQLAHVPLSDFRLQLRDLLQSSAILLRIAGFTKLCTPLLRKLSTWQRPRFEGQSCFREV